MESSDGKAKEEEEHDAAESASTLTSKTRGSIFSVCWDRTGQLLCRGSLDGTLHILNTHNPSKPYVNNNY